MDTLEQQIHELVQNAIKEATPKYKTTQYYLQNVEGYRDKVNAWAVASYQRNKAKVLAKKNDRYKNDEAFRELCKERAKKSREKRKLEKMAKTENTDNSS
jgi:hypothetical protein